ncbi:stage IV sporulation protein FA [Paenibacillus sp. UNCCL117]|uniref:peptidoglycan DD-metalloendopeptidase family protein n=1 Tax=unclassified Paenibacillus TaxID=185978 RepID=UPI000885A159|nr:MULTISPECIES: peptidoglycan DD-metalloendopeptidase family protein [unclassified Paenibacillus]SDD23803.1 stage IV sporulation protein FA [Paenibacillus sp. cl123]SFW41612.1 stage IV sporulation protein FA [Paenibacillus sp. UNCCL117]
MDTKKNVRDRRMEKIRRLQEHAWRNGHGEPALTHMSFPHEGERGRYERTEPEGPLVADRYDYEYGGIAPARPDPEVEWKRKYEREWSSYSSRYRDGGEDGGAHHPRGRRFAVRLALSGLLFAVVWGMYRIDHPWTERARAQVAAALSEPMNTAALAVWYERHFGGTPSFLPAIGGGSRHQEAEKVASLPKHYFAPMEGKLIASFTPALGGILMEARGGTPVAAVDTGMVVFAGMKDDTGYTVVLRHSGGMESTYGHLNAGGIRLNDWVKGGETVGTLAEPAGGQAPGALFFAFSKEGKPVDPSDVIPID